MFFHISFVFTILITWCCFGVRIFWVLRSVKNRVVCMESAWAPCRVWPYLLDPCLIQCSPLSILCVSYRCFLPLSLSGELGSSSSLEVTVAVQCINFTPFSQNKVTEKFKRPLKKRHSSVYHQPTNRVNKYLAQAIDARSVHREKATHVHLLTLCFKDPDKEVQVSGSCF